MVLPGKYTTVVAAGSHVVSEGKQQTSRGEGTDNMGNWVGTLFEYHGKPTSLLHFQKQLVQLMS